MEHLAETRIKKQVTGSEMMPAMLFFDPDQVRGTRLGYFEASGEAVSYLLLLTVERFEKADADSQILAESIGISTHAGRIRMQIMESFTEFDRVMLRERTQKQALRISAW